MSKTQYGFEVANVHMAAADADQQSRGLIAWVSCTLNGGLFLSGLTIRRTLKGYLRLSFPARRDSRGKEHHFVKPINERARIDIEHQVFQALGLKNGAEKVANTY